MVLPTGGNVTMLSLLFACVLTSAPAVEDEPAIIWEIGQTDNSYAEFAIPGNYPAYTKEFPEDTLFRVGRDQPKTSWPFIQPGPVDTWAGGRAHTSRIVFELEQPIKGFPSLVIDLVDTQSGSPPRLEVTVNGVRTNVQLPRGAGDASLTEAAAGREHVVRLPIAPSLLRQGENEIEMNIVDGSWVLYDSVRLEQVDNPDLESALHVEAEPLVRKSPTGPLQQIRIDVDVCGPAGQVELSLGDKTYRQAIPKRQLGRTSIILPIVPVLEPVQGTVTLNAQSQTLQGTIVVRPVRPWRIFLVQHTHSDVGYPDTQANLAARLVDYIDAAIDYVQQTDTYPDDAKFRWSCEATWSDDLFLKTRSGERIATLKKALADGRIELTAMPMNMTDLAPEEVLIHQLQIITQLRRELGAEIVTATQNDVNGYALSLPRLLAGCGVKYFATGINETRSLRPFDRPTGLHWESPDGSSVLTWRGEHYMAGNYLNETTDPDRVTHRLVDYLASLEQRDYPHSAVLLQFSGYGTDDAWPCPRVCDLVKNWNERFAWPKLRVATFREFFQAVEQESGIDLPRIRKAWCDWWADGNGTAVQEVALIRETHEQLESARALLAASATKSDLPALPAMIDHTMRRTLMFDEHTWGYAGSVNQPDSWMTKAQWGYKSAQAYEAALGTASIHDAAQEARANNIPTTAPSLVIENPSCWERGGIQQFRLPATATYGHQTFKLVDVATGEPVAVQSVGGAPIFDSIVAIDVPPVPALGYRVLRIEEEAPDPNQDTDLTCSGNVLENEFYRVEVDPKTGCLSSLLDKRADRQLAGQGDYGLLQYVYERVPQERGRGMFWPRQNELEFDRAVPDAVRITPGHNGPLMKSLRISAQVADDHRVECELLLYRATPRLDVRLTIHKPRNRDPEAGYLAFPLALENPRFDLDAVGGTFQPGPGQIDGTASDYHSVQRYVRVGEVSDGGLDVIVATLATPLVQIGDIHVGQYQERLAPPGPQFYMWLFNNYWFTNFPASQEGEMQFGFALTSRQHGDDAVSTAQRFGVETCQPLGIAYRPKGQPGDLPVDQLSSVEITPANAMITGVTWSRETDGVILRAREFDGKPTPVKLRFRAPWKIRNAEQVDLLEEPLRVLPIQDGWIEFQLQPFEMMTIRLTP
jgi:hypothetical protein